MAALEAGTGENIDSFFPCSQAVSIHPAFILISIIIGYPIHHTYSGTINVHCFVYYCLFQAQWVVLKWESSNGLSKLLPKAQL